MHSTSTRSTTPRRWSGSTRARWSRPSSSGNRSSRSANPRSPRRRRVRRTSKSSGRRRGPRWRWPCRSTSTSTSCAPHWTTPPKPPPVPRRSCSHSSARAGSTAPRRRSSPTRSSRRRVERHLPFRLRYSRAAAMNILLVIKNTANLRTLAPVVRLLAERGHDVRIACRDVKSPESQAQMAELVEGSPQITVVEHPFIRESGWSDLAGPLRRTIDYLRYLEPVYRDSPKLRARAASEAPPSGRRLGRLVAPVPGGPRASRRALQGVERCIEAPPRALAFLRDERPDVLVITPLIGFGTYQADLVRAAKRLGIPVSFPVRSWDNLTNKGLLRDAPDQVLVWNELQKREAVELHGVRPESVVVTGAPAYDHWFDWRSGRTREELCAAAGLDPGRPIVLYVGSSEFIAPDEPAFVRRWVDAVRARGGSLADAGLLVRPHPLAAAGFRDLRIDDPQVAIWPAHGEFPLAGEARQNYFDSIFHSVAVVGINTSAQIEAAIVDRPVYTILDAQYADTQAGTLHFRYLADDEFGHLHAAAALDEHAEQLERAVHGEVPGDLNQRFLRRFVRPFGLDVAATGLAVDAIGELGARGPLPPDRGPAAGPVVRLGLRPLATRAAAARRRQKQARAGLEPAAELKAAVRRLAEADSAIAAERWAGSTTHELLYWIPFLRWALLALPELRGRLAVAASPDALHLYEDLDAHVVAVEDGEDVKAVLGAPEVVVLEPGLVERHRKTLAATDPFARLHDRRLQFAPLRVSETTEGGVAVDGTFAAPVAEHRSLAGLVGEARTEAIAGAAAFLGSFGADACVAALAGRPAVVAEPPPEDTDDLHL